MVSHMQKEDVADRAAKAPSAFMGGWWMAWAVAANPSLSTGQ